MRSALIGAFLFASAAAPAVAHDVKTAAQPDGGLLSAPTLRLQPGAEALLMGLDRTQALLKESEDAVEHEPTGLRLPRVHAGCRLAATLPLGGGLPGFGGYAKGLVTEYDCTPAQALTHVEISFEAGSAAARRLGVAQTALKVAEGATKGKAQAGATACRGPAPSSLHFGKTYAECAVYWTDRKERQRYGVSTIALVQGDSFIRFTTTCVANQCDAMSKPFAAFVDSFDTQRLGSR